MPLHLFLLSSIFSFVMGTQCSGEGCDTKYQCNQGVGSVSAHEFSSPIPRPVFETPCECNEGWNDLFCTYPHIYSKSAVITVHTPTVCICRKQSDSNLRCEQFLSRCYKRYEGGCKCCFMQDEEFCDNVECKDDRPQFLDTNTTCHCFSQPIDYPTHICDGFGDKKGMQQKSSPYHLSILGFNVSAFVIIAAVVAVIAAVAVITMCCLVVSSKRRKRAREERERTQRERRERLGMPPESESFLQ